MPKTEKDLLYAIAEKVGGSRGERMRERLGKKTPFDDLLDSSLSDEEFAAQLKNAETVLPKVFAQIEQMGGKPRSWGSVQLKKMPNQSSEPTPTSGTSAAEQPLVPAAVVAVMRRA